MLVVMRAGQQTDEARDIVRLHEQTVQRADEHAQTYAGSAERRSETRPRTRTTHHIVVNRLVWEAAKKLAGGDASRLQIISATEVRVR
jgi:hypothetical protein